MSLDLTTRLSKLMLKNPVMSASGCFDWYPENPGPLNPNELGAVVLKSTTRKPRDGNPPIRVAETTGGMLNSVGIPSEGLDGFLQVLDEKWTKLNIPVVASIAGFSPEEYAELAAALGQHPVIRALELNLSCPNLEHDITPAQDPVLLRECITAVREATDTVIIAKLSPNVTDIRQFARISEDAGADALTLINTVRGTRIDIRSRKPLLAHTIGGLSGPAIKPIALAMVYEVYQAVKIPIIGVGGIAGAEDAIEFLLAGAAAVQVGSSSFQDPLTIPRVIAGIESYLQEEGFTRVQEIIGLAQSELVQLKLNIETSVTKASSGGFRRSR